MVDAIVVVLEMPGIYIHIKESIYINIKASSLNLQVSYFKSHGCQSLKGILLHLLILLSSSADIKPENGR